MIYPTEHTVRLELIKTAASQATFDNFKTVINEPTRDFFYDPWVIKPEFKGTVWEELLSCLPAHQGEARVISLKPGTSYYCHADADDRWHLNLQSEHGYLCDLENNTMYRLKPDGIWYSMDAGRLHTAANFGNKDRIQLVVRQLLIPNKIKNPVSIKIVLKKPAPDFRYQFDQTVSTWLNRANKRGIISNFVFADNEVKFDVDDQYLNNLQLSIPDIFEVIK